MQGQPVFVQYFGYCLPLAIPAVSVRNIVVKGFGITHYTVYGGFIVLFVWIVVVSTLCFIAIKRKKYSE